MNDKNSTEQLIQELATDYYEGRSDTITELLTNKIKIQRCTIIDLLLEYHSNHFKELSNNEYEQIRKAIKSNEEQEEGLSKKLTIIEKIENNPPKDFADYNERLTKLIILANYDISTSQGDISTLAFENGEETLNFIKNHTQNILLEKTPLSDDSKEIINLGISLSLIYGYFLSLKLIEPKEIALLSKLDLIANKFFYAFGKHVDNETEISELNHLVELEKTEKNRVEQIKINKYVGWNTTLIPFIEHLFQKGKLKNKRRIDSIADEILIQARLQDTKGIPVKKTIVSCLKEVFSLKPKQDAPPNWVHNKIKITQQ